MSSPRFLVDAAGKVQLDVFEGPFDLLLFFIERDELDIHDIPIARLSEQFLSHLVQAKSLKLDLASDFIRVATTLIRIKARMLLPLASALEETEEEVADPREALAQQLLRYRRVRKAGEALDTLALRRSLQSPRGNARAGFEALEETFIASRSLATLSLDNLLRVYRRLHTFRQDQKNQPTQHRVQLLAHSVETQKAYLLKQLSKQKQIPFLDLIPLKAPRQERRLLCVCNLLATLELWQQRKLSVQGFDDKYNAFYLLAP